jgi:peptidoglycan/LPS O-acetylase OafA/YrhL
MHTLAGTRNSANPVAGGMARAEVPGLTGLRFIAAFTVVIAHSPGYILPLQSRGSGPVYWIETASNFGMVLFFVLSGFVIHYNYRVAVTRGGLDGVGGFVWARFARLYPLYAFMVLLDLLLGQKFFQFMAGNTEVFADEFAALPYYATFTQSWLYKSFGDSTLFSVVGTDLALTWSISTEWFFYLSYPLVALLVIRARRPLVTIIVALVWCAVWIAVVNVLSYNTPRIDAGAVGRYGQIAGLEHGGQDAYFWWLMYLSPYLRIGEFILGCLIAQLYIQLQGKPPSDRERIVGWLLLGVGAVTVPVLTYIMYAPNVNWGYLGYIRLLSHNFGFAPSVALILFCAARYDTLFSRVLNSRPVVALGEASYSIYLIHFIILIIVSSVVADLLPLTLPNIVFAISKVLFVLALIMLISLGLHAYVEVPARQWLRGLWRETAGRRRRVVAWSILASPGVAAALIAVAIPSVAVDPSASVANGVRVRSATYGASCGVRRGNTTTTLRKACDGKDSCNYVVDVDVLGDPAPGCSKDFVVDYECAPDATRLAKNLPAEAGLGSPLLLSCAPNATAAASVDAPPALSAPSDLPVGRATADAVVPATAIKVRSATYGGNCGAPSGNATSDVQLSCDGDRKCTYTVDVERLGDPAPSCAKAFALEYECAPGGPGLKADVAGEAGLGKSVDLQCPSGPANTGPSQQAPTSTRPASAAASSAPGIGVLSATYGGNCGAPVGNATAAVASACGGRATCNYAVDVNKLGDPAPRCAKSFFVKFQCGGDSTTRSTAVRGEAGLGSLIHLACP